MAHFGIAVVENGDLRAGFARIGAEHCFNVRARRGQTLMQGLAQRHAFDQIVSVDQRVWAFFSHACS